MYDENVDFYTLSKTKQRGLVHNKRAATADRLLKEVPENKPAVRIFEKSLEELILDQLEQGQYTVAELADHFNVQPDDVRRILNRYRRRGANDFTNQNFELNLLENRRGVIRGVNSAGRSLYYSLETIPFFARVLDPTLLFSLLNLRDHIDEFPHITKHIPNGKATDLDEDYAFVIGDYWDIDPEEIFDYLTEYDRAYIDTSLLPLPYVRKDEQYDRVAERFKQVDDVYRRYRGTSNHLQEVADDFRNRVEEDQAGITAYQVTSIDFADFQWYSNQTGDYALQKEIDKQIAQIVKSLHPDQSTTGREEPANELDVNLRDEIQLVLSETPQTPTEIHESLPRDVQLGTYRSEVVSVLEKLHNTGVISKETNRSNSQYFVQSTYI